MGKHHYDALPRASRAPVDQLVKTLQALLEDNLRGVIVYGSAARGDYRAGTSDIDVVVVLKDPSPALLHRIADPIALARASGRVETMLLTEEEIERGADVFPLYYEDIQKCHAVIHGADPFEALVIGPENRRLRIEQELREARIRLREALVDGRGDERALGRAVARKLRQVRFPLRALLELVGVECTSYSLDIVVEKACRKFVIDGSALRRPDEKPEAAYQALSALLARAIDVVDHLAESA